MSNTHPLRNTPKIISPDSPGAIPSTYRVKKFELKNSEDVTADILPIVQSFTLTEEVFSVINVLNIRVYDDINFFETMKLSGQEKITLELETDITYVDDAADGGKTNRKNTYSYVFAVKEYPNYQKDINTQHVQEYNIICIPTYAYLSALTRISRAVEGAVTENINNIFKNDLLLGKNKTDETVEVIGDPITQFDGVITIQSPLKAVEWLRTKLYDDISSPFFIYRPFRENKIYIHGLTKIIDEKIYRTIKYYPFLQGSSSNSQGESSERIYNLKSTIKMDKLAQALGGGFSSKVQLVNISKKTTNEKTVNYSNSISNKITSKLNPITSYLKSVFFLNTNDSKNAETQIESYAGANTQSVQTNSNENSITSDDVISNLILQKSLTSRLDSRNQELELNGDLHLNPGQKLDLQIGRMFNPKKVLLGEETNKNSKDEYMSGPYIIGVAVHTFKEGLFRTRLKVFNDI
jgi:hypothetical protein